MYVGEDANVPYPATSGYTRLMVKGEGVGAGGPVVMMCLFIEDRRTCNLCTCSIDQEVFCLNVWSSILRDKRKLRT